MLAMLAAAPVARAAEHVTLKNGFELDCVRREADGEHVRLYFASTASEPANYIEVVPDSIVRIETVSADPALPASLAGIKTPAAAATNIAPTASEMKEMLARAGERHHIDADMLASVVKAESGGHIHAVSRTGARGLMQLMPGTADQLGVADAFRPDQNIAGGTAYLDRLLTRYHDNVALALAAYNAGPGAVDRWHGIPPYRETQAYVARVIREFNRRKQTLLASAK